MSEPVRIPLDDPAGARLRLVPRVSLTLDPPRLELRGGRATVELTGRATGPLDGVACRATWLVQRDGEPVRRADAGAAPLAVGADGRARLSVPLDALAHGLAPGRGALGVEVRPGVPRAAAATVEPGRGPRFDLPLDVDVRGSGGPARIGSIVELVPRVAPALDGLALTLEVREHDEGEPPDDADLRRTFTWHAGDRAPRRWRVGCTEADGPVTFDYPERAEAGPTYELQASLSATAAGGARHAVRTWRLLDVPRPRLAAFELALVGRPLLDAVGAALAGRPGVVVVARGQLEGYAPGLEVPVRVDLLARGRDGGLHALGSPTVATTTDGAGRFEVRALDPGALPGLEARGRELTGALSVGGAAADAPLATVVDFDAARHLPLEGARPCAKERADRAASSNAVRLEG